MPDDDGSRPKRFVVDGILPVNLVHLVAAPVGTGKTTMFMQLIHAMQNQSEWLTKKAYPRRVVYITADRGKAETEATILRLGLVGLEYKLVSLKDRKETVVAPLELLLHTNCERNDLVIVEPINFFIKDGSKSGNINDFGHVSRFLLTIGKKCEEMSITVIGSLHSSKAKQGAQYMVAREKVIGSVAWTAFTATTIVIEPADPATCDDPGRVIHVLPRDMRPFTLEYTVEPEHGLFIPVATTKAFKSRLDELFELHPDVTFTAQDLENWREQAGVRRATAWRWLEQKIDDGYVERIGRGLYRKRTPT